MKIHKLYGKSLQGHTWMWYQKPSFVLKIKKQVNNSAFQTDHCNMNRVYWFISFASVDTHLVLYALRYYRAELESQSELLYDWRFLPPISPSWRQALWDSRPVILFSNWTLAVIVLMLYHLWREDESVVYNCCWPSLAQSFSGPSPAGLITTF
jgi:hypothetical protein